MALSTPRQTAKQPLLSRASLPHPVFPIDERKLGENFFLSRSHHKVRRAIRPYRNRKSMIDNDSSGAPMSLSTHRQSSSRPASRGLPRSPNFPNARGRNRDGSCRSPLFTASRCFTTPVPRSQASPPVSTETLIVCVSTRTFYKKHCWRFAL